MNPPKTNHEFRSRRAAAETVLADAEQRLATVKALSDGILTALQLGYADLNTAYQRLDLFLSTSQGEAMTFANATLHRRLAWIRAEREVLLLTMPDHRWLATIEMLNANLSAMRPPATDADVVAATARAAYRLLYADDTGSASIIEPGASETEVLKELTAQLSAHLLASAQPAANTQPAAEERPEPTNPAKTDARYCLMLSKLRHESRLLAETEVNYLCAIGPYASELEVPFGTFCAAVLLQPEWSALRQDDPASLPNVLITFGQEMLEHARQMRDLHPRILKQDPIVASVAVTMTKGMMATLAYAHGFIKAGVKACDDAVAERRAALDALPPR